MLRHDFSCPAAIRGLFASKAGLPPVHLPADWQHVSKVWFRLMEMVLSELVLVALLLAVVMISGRF